MLEQKLAHQRLARAARPGGHAQRGAEIRRIGAIGVPVYLCAHVLLFKRVVHLEGVLCVAGI